MVQCEQTFIEKQCLAELQSLTSPYFFSYWSQPVSALPGV